MHRGTTERSTDHGAYPNCLSRAEAQRRRGEQDFRSIAYGGNRFSDFTLDKDCSDSWFRNSLRLRASQLLSLRRLPDPFLPQRR